MRTIRASTLIGTALSLMLGQAGALAQPAQAEPDTAPRAVSESASQTTQGGEKSGSAPGSAATRRRLSDASELERIVSLYAGGKYEECSREVAVLLDPDNPERLMNPTVVEDAHLYHATCLVMSGRDKEAIAPLRAVLTDNPTRGVPDSLTFPPPLVSLFLEVRKEFADAIKAQEKARLEAITAQAERAKQLHQAERRRVEALEKLARTETVIERHSRLMASVPFGMGQYQNENYALGHTLFVGESLLLGTSLVAVGVWTRQLALVSPNTFNNDIQRNANRAKKVALISFYSFLGVALGGIAEAHINFVPSVESKRVRPLPDELKAREPALSSRVVPWVEPQDSGLSFGVMGTF